MSSSGVSTKRSPLFPAWISGIICRLQSGKLSAIENQGNSPRDEPTDDCAQQRREIKAKGGKQPGEAAGR